MAVKLPFQTIIESAPLQGGSKWEDISRNLIESYAQSQDEAGIDLSAKFDELIQGNFDTLDDYFVNLQDFQKEEIQKGMNSLESRDKESVKRLLDQIDTRIRRGRDIDHNDITYVNSRIALTINLLDGGARAAEEATVDPDVAAEMDAYSQRALSRVEGSKMGGIPAFGGGRSDRTPAQNMKVAANALRKVLAVAERLEIYINTNAKQPSSIDEIIKELEEAGTIQLDKQKYIDALDGQADAVYRLTTPEFNQDVKGGQKGGIGQKQIGQMRRAIESSNRKLFADTEKDMMKIIESSMQVEGSERIDKALLDQLEASFLQRKAKAQRSNSSKKIRVKPRKFRTKAQRRKAEADAKARQAETALRGIVARSAIGSRTKRRNPKQQRDLNLLRTKINAELPAKMAQEMGRPFLEERSGTFQNSVRLETLTRGPKTVVGQYSYQYSPYETFENSSRWPSGYNPKPVISRAIRELATAEVASKFTLRKF
jgi:hypothetical protein